MRAEQAQWRPGSRGLAEQPPRTALWGWNVLSKRGRANNTFVSRTAALERISAFALRLNACTTRFLDCRLLCCVALSAVLNSRLVFRVHINNHIADSRKYKSLTFPSSHSRRLLSSRSNYINKQETQRTNPASTNKSRLKANCVWTSE